MSHIANFYVNKWQNDIERILTHIVWILGGKHNITLGIYDVLDIKFNDLGLDSIDIIEILMECEYHFNVQVKLDDKKTHDLTIEDLITIIWYGLDT